MALVNLEALYNESPQLSASASLTQKTSAGVCCDQTAATSTPISVLSLPPGPPSLYTDQFSLLL